MPARQSSLLLFSLACIITSFATLSGCAQPIQQDDYRPYLVADYHKQLAAETANDRTQRKLAAIVNVNFDNHRLVNAIDYLRQRSDVNFFVNWAALEGAGIEKSIPKPFHIPRGPADQALRALLKQAADEAELEPMDFAIIEGVVHISSVRDLHRLTQQWRVYDIRGLFPRLAADHPLHDQNIWKEQRNQQLAMLSGMFKEERRDRPDTFWQFGHGELVVRATPMQHAAISQRFHEARYGSNAGEPIEYRDRWTNIRTQITRDYLNPLVITGESFWLTERLPLAAKIDANFDANKLVNILDYLKNRGGIDIVVNWEALEAVGVEQDLPITLRLTDLPVEKVLSLVLQQAGAGAELEPIGYCVTDVDVVHVSSQADLDRRFRRVGVNQFDLRDVLKTDPTVPADFPGTHADLENQLVEITQHMVGDSLVPPNEFDAADTSTGSIFRMKLMPAEHDKFEQLLEALRLSRGRAGARHEVGN